jgi:hypothetical protein
VTNIPVSGEAQMWPNYEDFRPEPSFDDNLSEDVVRALAASGINVSVPLVRHAWHYATHPEPSLEHITDPEKVCSEDVIAGFVLFDTFAQSPHPEQIRKRIDEWYPTYWRDDHKQAEEDARLALIKFLTWVDDDYFHSFEGRYYRYGQHSAETWLKLRDELQRTYNRNARMVAKFLAKNVALDMSLTADLPEEIVQGQQGIQR